MINVAILGAGIGSQHLAGYRALPDIFRVAAMCDLDAARARDATGGHPDIAILAEVDDVLSDPEIHLVDVCLPPHLHTPVVIKILEAGKHAVCEKPIARSLADAQKMQATMEATGREIFPVFQYRYGRAFAQLAALRDAGLAGRALVASAETHWNREKPYYDVPWRGTWRGESGGAVLGHAIHMHDILCHLLGPVAELTAYTDTRVNDIEVEDCAAIALRMQSGALVTSSVTLGAANDTSRLRICFEGLTVESGTAPYTPAEDTWTFSARGATLQADIDRIVADVAMPHAGFTGFLEAVAQTLTGTPGRAVTFEDGRRSIEFVTAVYLSAREGRAVKLPIARKDPIYDGWSPH